MEESRTARAVEGNPSWDEEPVGPVSEGEKEGGVSEGKVRGGPQEGRRVVILQRPEFTGTGVTRPARVPRRVETRPRVGVKRVGE